MRRRDIVPYLTDGLIRSIPFLTCFGFLFLGLFPFRLSFFVELFVPFIFGGKHRRSWMQLAAPVGDGRNRPGASLGVR